MPPPHTTSFSSSLIHKQFMHAVLVPSYLFIYLLRLWGGGAGGMVALNELIF